MTRFSLHGMWPSGPTYKVALMLRLTDTPHDFNHIDLQAGAQREEAYLEKNPFGQVPVLEDSEEGIFISQSSVILDYLANETRQFNGKDRLERVKARQWQFWGAGGLSNGIYRTRAAKLGFFKFAADVEVANLAAGTAALEQLEGFLDGRDWLVGDAASIADIDLYGVTAYAPQAQMDLAPYANVTRWMSGVEALPRFCRCHDMRAQGKRQRMITGLDHMVLVCPDIEAGIADYAALLGHAPVWRHVRDGAAAALFQFENTALELLAPDGDGDTAVRLREILEADGPGLKTIVFATDDVDAAHHTLTRRGLAPSEAIDQSVEEFGGGRTRSWRRFRLSNAHTHGLKTLVIKYGERMPASDVGDDAVHALDHIVVTTPNPNRAMAHYGAKLGLDFKLDRIIEKFFTRFLFFKTGGLIFEVVHSTKGAPDPNGPDAIMGLTYEVRDLQAAHERLSIAGLNVSEMRKGRKAGSSVFTVRNGTLEVPTLFIAHAPR